MSKKRRKKDCCCMCDDCCCMNDCCCPTECCCPTDCCCQGNFDGNNGFGCDILVVLVFWLIACGAGLLNTNSILIILLFLLYGWSGDGGCSNGFGW